MRLPPEFKPGEICWITGRAPFVKLWPVGYGGPIVIEECPKCKARFWRPRPEAKHRC